MDYDVIFRCYLQFLLNLVLLRFYPSENASTIEYIKYVRAKIAKEET